MVETTLPDGLETFGQRIYRQFWYIYRRFEFFRFGLFSQFLIFFVFVYSWSTLLWHRCYYPHWSRDSMSPVCGIFLVLFVKCKKNESIFLFGEGPKNCFGEVPGTAIMPGQHGMLLSRPKGSLVPCADTFRDKLLLDGSQSREHKGPPPSFNTTAESMLIPPLSTVDWHIVGCSIVGWFRKQTDRHTDKHRDSLTEWPKGQFSEKHGDSCI